MSMTTMTNVPTAHGRIKLRVGHYVSFRPTDGEWPREGLVMHISDEGVVKVAEKNGRLHEITFKQIKEIIP